MSVKLRNYPRDTNLCAVRFIVSVLMDVWLSTSLVKCCTKAVQRLGLLLDEF